MVGMGDRVGREHVGKGMLLVAEPEEAGPQSGSGFTTQSLSQKEAKIVFRPAREPL